jgi:hypothetical protein
MSLRLIKPGMRHPHTGALIKPLYVREDGSAVWPVIGASPDDSSNDQDDEKYTGGSEDDDSEDDDSEDDDEEDKKSSKKRSSKKGKDDDEDDDDEDEDDDDPKLARASRQAARYRTELRAQQKTNAELLARLKAIEDKDKKPEEIQSREAEEAKTRAAKAEERARKVQLENAFLRANSVDWVDKSDAFRLVDLDDVDVDEDGTVDERQLARALRALAKRKPHLVKKPKTTESDDDEDEDEKDQGSARQMNGKRRGRKGTGNSREELAKKFPVLGRL